MYIVTQLGGPNAFADLQDPFEFNGFPGLSPGDNPVTSLTETYGYPSLMGVFDTPVWEQAVLGYDKDIMNGDVSVTYPENVNVTPDPTYLNSDELLGGVIGHEFAHNCQQSSGIVDILPVEGMAVALEQDTKLSQVNATQAPFLFIRSRRLSNYYANAVRGEWSIMRPGASVVSPNNTYGSSPFWRYLATQFDVNNQCQRRSADILSNEPGYLNQIAKSLDLPPGVNNGLNIYVNGAGSAKALDQSMTELYTRNLKDVYTDYSVSLAFMRNNTSIPEKWRHNFPYWFYSTDYPGNSFFKIFGFLVLPGSTWWQLMDTNSAIPPDWGTPNTGESVIPTLTDPVSKDVQDLTSMLFNIDKATTTDVTVDIASGEWRFYMVQFTSDGTSVGSFIEHPDNEVSINGAGTHTFTNIPGVFTGAGNIRLVCAHVTMTNYPGNGGLDNYTKFPINSGSISISKI